MTRKLIFDKRMTPNEKSVYWRKNNPEKSKLRKKTSYLKKLYGFTLDEWNEMFDAQDGKCAICGKHQTEIGKTLGVDHCHKTGKIRGLLCTTCNRGLGYFKDDIENLRCAIMYLNKKE